MVVCRNLRIDSEDMENDSFSVITKLYIDAS
jgi:hypothetical protein